MQSYADLMRPLQLLTSPKNRWVWGKEQEDCMKKAKQRLTETPVLIHPDMDKRFFLKTDASQYAVGAVLCQLAEIVQGTKSVKTGKEVAEAVVEYFSRQLKGAQISWTTTVRECYGILLSVRHFSFVQAVYVGDRPQGTIAYVH